MEVLPQIYQDLYKYLPFPYAMNALRETVGGLYENYYWDCIRHLLLYIPVSVIIGLVCGKPFEKLNHKIEENKDAVIHDGRTRNWQNCIFIMEQ